MAEQGVEFQPGAILYGVIIFAFRARGTTLNQWCRENGVNLNRVRAAAFGQASGPGGRKLLSRIVEAAGRETVEAGYRLRVQEEAERLAAAGGR